MYSNGWNQTQSRLRKTSHPHHLNNTFSPYHQSTLNAIPKQKYHDSSMISLKADLLTKKLKSKSPKFQNTLTHSRTSLLYSTKSPSKIRFSDATQDCSYSQVKIQQEFLQNNNQNQIQWLEERTNELQETYMKSKEQYQIQRVQISGELQTIAGIIKEIGQRCTNYDNPLKKEFKMYSDLLQYAKEKEQIILKKNNSRKKTFSSAVKEPSLLLSFKKNMEQQQGYMTLKYSEDSHGKEHNNDTLVDGWQSFHKDPKSKVKKKLDYRNQIRQSNLTWQEQLQDKYFDAIKTEILSHLHHQKSQIIESHKASVNLFKKLQNMLELIVEEIAQEKVERQHEKKNIQKLNCDELDQIDAYIYQLKKETTHFEDDFDEKLKNIEFQYMDKLSIEKAQREFEAKTMIRIMMDVVDSFK